MLTLRKKPKKPQIIFTWIRQRISPFCYGVKTRAGYPAHCNRNEDVLHYFKSLKSGWWCRPLSRLRNADMADHFAGRKTFYFTADGRSGTKEVLVNIDIDCHKSGSLEGAVAFARHLRDTRFPDLYFETSTNGNGVHGYIVVVKGNLGDEGLNGALGQLDLWLKGELSRGGWDVEDVEVKGHAPEFGWGREKFELKTYRSGQLAKLPRDALVRAVELRGTTRVAVGELQRLPVPARAESGDSVVRQEARPNLRLVGAVKTETRNGSIAGRHFSQGELAKLRGGYLSLGKELLGETKLVATGRKVVTEDDVAIFLMLLRFFSRNMNSDGSLPVARWREMWTALYEAGDIGRAWCHRRFAAIRNFLSDDGLLDWQQTNFTAGIVGEDGRFMPGKASKWRAGEELMVRMEATEAQEVGVVEDLGEKEEGRNILYGCSIPDEGEDRRRREGGSILYGRTVSSSTHFPPNPRQSQPLQIVLEHLGIEIPLQRPRFAGYSWGPMRMAA